MAKTAELLKQFWGDEHLRDMSPRGRLALFYAFTFDVSDEEIIIEDMVAHTGLDYSECKTWLAHFDNLGLRQTQAGGSCRG